MFALAHLPLLLENPGLVCREDLYSSPVAGLHGNANHGDENLTPNLCPEFVLGIKFISKKKDIGVGGLKSGKEGPKIGDGVGEGALRF